MIEINFNNHLFICDTDKLNNLGYKLASNSPLYLLFIKIEGDFKNYIFIRKDKRWYYNTVYKGKKNNYTRGLSVEETEAILTCIKSILPVEIPLEIAKSAKKSINEELGILGE